MFPLIRHAYVRNSYRHEGIGKKLLTHLCEQTTRPILVGTWAASKWAIGFYERNGFRQVTKEAKKKLLRKYWTIPERQIETSVVLVDTIFGLEPSDSHLPDGKGSNR
jgi:N-acetylglutamate synthase-like GNAT family acetyltransferase